MNVFSAINMPRLILLTFVLFSSAWTVLGIGIFQANRHPAGYLGESIVKPEALAPHGSANHGDSTLALYGRGDSESGSDVFPFRIYVTPDSPSVLTLAAEVTGIEDAYKRAAGWIYVKEERLNDTDDLWLTPEEFLAATPGYDGNPLPGIAVSDCEEQANTLASLLRAVGVPPESVRVVIGQVFFNSENVGHVWVEVRFDGAWRVLDPTSGPYWDDKAGKLVQRDGNDFDYYVNHRFPVIETWAYYNDVYFIDLIHGPGDAADSWPD